MYIVPRYSVVVVLFESIINFSMIVLGIFLPYVQNVLYVDYILDADFKAMEASLNVQSIVNLVIVGSFVVLTFHKSVQTIQESLGFVEPPSKQSRESETG